MFKLLKFQKGDKVQFNYKNSVGEVVHAYGIVKSFSNRYYNVDIGCDMPIMRVYGSKLHPAGDTQVYSCKNEVQCLNETHNDVKSSFVMTDYTGILHRITWLLWGIFSMCTVGALATILSIIL